MSYRYVNVEKLKSKRKKNQYINELIASCYPDLMISKKEFIKRHKEEVTSIFERLGYDISTEMYVSDCLTAHYWYRDPICYKTCLNNSDLLDFDEKFVELFGEEMKYNKVFLKKIKRLNNRYMFC